jgi:AraC-like DNA-binding protein
MESNTDITTHTYISAVNHIGQKYDKKQFLSRKELPLILTKFEMMEDAAFDEQPHRHDYHELLYICDGKGRHTIDSESYPVLPSTVYFLAKDQIHSWQVKQPIRGYIMLLPDDFLGALSSDGVQAGDFSFFNNGAHKPYLRLNQQQDLLMKKLLEGLERELLIESGDKITVIRAYLHILLTKLHRIYTAGSPQSHSQEGASLAHEFEQLVTKHFLSIQSVHEYAELMGISTSHLRENVKSATGYTPGNFIREQLTREAKRLLAYSDATAGEIGNHLSFKDASYFGRFFKRETGMSPNTFRKELRKQ